MWSSSLSKLSCGEEIVFALCARVFEDALFSCDVVVAIPVKILVCVGGFSVYCGAEGVVWLDGDESVQER